MHIVIVCKPRTLDEAKEAESIIAAFRSTVAGHGGTTSNLMREHTLTAPEGGHWYDRGLVLTATGTLNRAGPDIPLLKAAE